MKFPFRFILAFIMIVVSIAVYVLVNNKEKENIRQEPFYQPFCGTKSDTGDNPDAIEGKRIFNSNCAACHKLDAQSTGPALRNIVMDYKENGLSLCDFLKGKNKKRLYKDLVKKDFEHTIFKNLTEKDVASLEAYMQPRY